MNKREWVITGYDSSETVFSYRLPEGALSEAEMIVLLQRLQSRHLTEAEVVGASMRRNASGYRRDLEIQRNHGEKFGLMTNGSSWHYTATIEVKNAQGT